MYCFHTYTIFLFLQVHASTFITPSRLHNTSTKRRIRETYCKIITNLCQQLYTSRQQQQRSRKSIASLQTVLQFLMKEKLVRIEDFQEIADFSECNKNLLNRQIRKLNKSKNPRMYESELRRFVLTLHYYSPPPEPIIT